MLLYRELSPVPVGGCPPLAATATGMRAHKVGYCVMAQTSQRNSLSAAHFAAGREAQIDRPLLLHLALVRFLTVLLNSIIFRIESISQRTCID